SILFLLKMNQIKSNLGRPQLVDREKILTAVLAVGIEQFSMHSVAKYLGVSATTLYRYFDSKEALLDACMDEFCACIHLPPKTLHWQEYLRRLGHEFRDALKQMPGAYAYGTRLGPTTPAAFRIIEESLTVLLADGFEHRLAWRAYGMLLDHVFVFAEKEERMAALEQTHGPGGYKVLRLSPDESKPYPNMTETLTAVMPPDFDHSYEEQLQTLLNGIAADLKQQTQAEAGK
ncbi:MAG: TetR/AcrR family transcriptional regulator C-terminal domain-containing protein, partial [Pseudomonadota bacterium]